MKDLDRVCSIWHQEPPADPIFLRRVARLRWERGLAIGVVGTVCLFALFFRHFGGFYVWWASLAALVRWAFTRRAAPSVAGLMDLPANDDQFPVALKLVQNGATYGSDTGVVSFNEGWLSFQGLRTEFAVQPGHVVASASWAGQKRPGKPGGELYLKLSYVMDGRTYVAYLTPLDRVDGVGSGYRRRFIGAAQKWRYETPREPGTAVYPPVTAHESAVLFSRLLVRTNLVLLAVLGGAGVVGLLLGKGFGLEVVLFGLAGLAGLVLRFTTTCNKVVKGMSAVATVSLPSSAVQAEEPTVQVRAR